MRDVEGRGERREEKATQSKARREIRGGREEKRNEERERKEKRRKGQRRGRKRIYRKRKGEK